MYSAFFSSMFFPPQLDLIFHSKSINIISFCSRTSMDTMKFSCQNCRYVYDPQSKVDDGVPFDELPGDWLCPKCFKADKSEFIEVKDGKPGQKEGIKVHSK